MRNDIYNIVVVSDEGYVQHTGVMLYSLFCLNKDKYFRIFYITDYISDSNRLNLENLCISFKAKIEFKICNIDLILKFPCGNWSHLIYLKLYIPIILPNDVDRCLFLDSDIIVNDDINDLYNIDLNDNIIAAAEDNPDGDLHKKRLGLSSNDIYINSGVVVCDILNWKQAQQNRDIFRFAQSMVHKIINEQDVLSFYFKGKIKILPIRWNMVTHYFLRVPKIYDKYLTELSLSRKKPGIIHFCSPIKPWFKDCDHPYGNLYRKYLLETVWKHYKFPIYENLSFYKRVKKKIKYFFNSLGIRKDKMFLTK